MRNEKEFIETYKSAYSKIDAPEKLKAEVLNLQKSGTKKHLSIAVKISLAAAAVVMAFVLSNLVTWAAAGNPWIYTVSSGLYEREYEKMQERNQVPDSTVINNVYSEDADGSEESLKESIDISEIVSAKSIDELSEDDYKALDAWFDNAAQINERQIIQSAFEAGYVYQFEKIEVYSSAYGTPLHDYQYLGSFSTEELKNAVFNNDYTWVNISGEDYYVMRSHTGDFKELDEELPNLENGTDIIRVFSKENYEDWARISADEGIEYIKKSLAMPIFEGRVAVYSNEDNSIIRSFSEQECKTAEISENFQVVRIAGDIYIVTYILEDDGINTKEVRLRSPEGYKGDATAENIADQHFYTMEDFNLGD